MWVAEAPEQNKEIWNQHIACPSEGTHKKMLQWENLVKEEAKKWKTIFIVYFGLSYKYLLLCLYSTDPTA